MGRVLLFAVDAVPYGADLEGHDVLGELLGEHQHGIGRDSGCEDVLPVHFTLLFAALAVVPGARVVAAVAAVVAVAAVPAMGPVEPVALLPLPLVDCVDYDACEDCGQ